MSSNYQVVRTAVINRQIILADYQGYPREMCPHAIGRNKTGREQALFYQFGGSSKSGLAPAGSPANWRCIPVEGLENVRAVSGDWRTAPNHSRPQTCVHEIDVETR